jgi:hypothetical protein
MNEGAQIILAIAIAVCGGGSLLMLVGAVARRIAGRIMHGKTLAPGTLPPDEHRVDDLSGEVAALRQALEEQQERMDFAERLLAQVKDKSALPGPR